MGEPRAVTFNDCKKAFEKDEVAASEAWAKICHITGAGSPNEIGKETAIDITDLSDAKIQQIDKVLTPDAPDKSATPQKTNK